MEPLVILTGPTGVGKTELSISLARAIGGEIISADSMQVYRGMNVGTAKIRPEEMQGVVHYGIDLIEPTGPWDVTRFVEMSEKAIRTIRANGHIPIVVGGTGFYIQALLKGLSYEEEPDDTTYRDGLAGIDKETLHAQLAEVDPESAAAIPAGNKKRVIRALEYYHFHGEPISELNKRQKETASPYNFAYFVLTLERSALYERINRRVDSMIENGLAEEVKSLVEGGMPEQCQAMLAIGYRQILPYLHGECTLAEAGEQIKLETRHFAKRQMTWFRREADAILLPKDNADEGALLAEILRVLRDKEIFTGV
ncbi:MAG: tRNA (adenosine(37)-N6)-dimethylallyltransferase MiaA [Lachnospiraceae bacterium]|nr:tRNA (adenosine(37)-N6)-dimethylallyltransferase MiaA [Lachnospiraceae bacterium]